MKFEFLKSNCQNSLGFLKNACYLDSFIRRRNRRPPDEIFMTSSSIFETDPVSSEGRGLDKCSKSDSVLYKDGVVDAALTFSPELHVQPFCGNGDNLSLCYGSD